MAGRKVIHEALHFLRTNELAIKTQVMLLIIFAHIDHPYKKYYERIYSTRGRCKGPRSFASELESSSHHAVQEIDCEKLTSSRLSQPQRASKRQEQHGSKENMFETVERSDEWDWRGVPQKWFIASLYEFIANSSMIYASLRTVFGDILRPLFNLLVSSWSGIPAQCFLVGRFVLHPKVDHVSPLVLSSFHLGWRAVQRFTDRRLMLGPLTFLLQSEHDISKFLGIMQRNTSGAYLSESDEPLSVESEEVPAGMALMWHRWAKYNDFCPWLAATEQGAVNRQQLQDERIGVHEHFLRHLMCYEVHSKHGIHYKLRPNRTLEAHNKLAASLVNFCLVSAASLTALAIPITIVVVLIVLSDFRYVQIYPGCFPELDRLFANGQLSFWSFTIERHHLVALFFDTLENVVIWLDSGFALTFVVALTYFLNWDLLLYWRHLHRRLETATERMRGLHMLKEYVECNGRSVSGLSRSPFKRLLDVEAAQLSALINEIQFEIYDFFLQVERADHIVSDILTMAIIIWLFCCALLSYFFLTRMETELPLVIKVVQILGLLVITAASKYLLTLHRCCMQSYKLICALMAHEQTHKTKRQFIKVLQFFSERNRTTYTLFQHYPYLATTYIALIGWSLSCFAIAYGLFGHGQFKSVSGVQNTHRYFDF